MKVCPICDNELNYEKWDTDFLLTYCCHPKTIFNVGSNKVEISIEKYYGDIGFYIAQHQEIFIHSYSGIAPSLKDQFTLIRSNGLILFNSKDYIPLSKDGLNKLVEKYSKLSLLL